MGVVMPDKRKKFDQEFRAGAVRIVAETGKPIAQIARDLGVNEGTLGNWVVKDEHEVLFRHHFATRAEARAVLGAWCHDFYNTDRRHSSAAMLAPIDYENTSAQPTDGQEAA